MKYWITWTSTPESLDMGGAPPIRTIGFDKPPVGRAKLDCLKQRASRKTPSLEHLSLEHRSELFWYS